MDLVYGISLSGPEDDFVLRIEHVSETFGRMKVPGAFLADIIPVLQYIPTWCPGGAAQRFVSEHRPLITSLKNEPFNTVKADMVRDTLRLLLCSYLVTVSEGERR